MDRRLLIVFALTFLVIMLFQPLLKKYGPQPPAKSAAGVGPAGQPGAAVPMQAPAQLPTQPSASPRAAAKAPVSAPLQAASESETVIENDVYRIVFTNRGGRVKSWVLKKYTDDKGRPLELVNAEAAEKYGFPLALWSYDETLRNKLNSVLYAVPTLSQSARKDGAAAVDGAPAVKDSAPAVDETKFAYNDGDVSVQKRFTFDRNT